MITQFPNPSASPMIEKLRQGMEESGDGYEWLLIAHSDDRLVRSLSAALAHLPVFILQAPQESWDFQRGELAEAIEWAIHQTSLKHLALVGHSRIQVDDAAETSSQPVSEDTSSGYQRLREGVTRTTARTRESQARFSQHFEQLISGPVVRQQSLDGDLSVYGLFFIDESAAFLAYDSDRKTFLPLNP
jgi:hypothetical protein